MTETVLVIGGTGELGAPVTRQLRDDGYRVRVLARRRRRRRLTYVSHMLAAPDAAAPPCGPLS